MPKSKLSQVGFIPNDWSCVRLGDVGEVKMCKRIFKDQTKEIGEIPFYKIGTFGGCADAFISKELFDEFTKKFSFPKAGDILISAAGTIGRTVKYDGSPSYFQDSNIVWIDNDESKVSNEYLGHYYKTVKWATSDGGTVARLYNDNLKNKIYIAFPEIAEQNKISSVLNNMDTLLESMKKLVEKKRNIKLAVMQELLTGKKRLRESYKKWDVKLLGEIVNIQKGQLLTSSSLSPGDVPVIAGGKEPAYFHSTPNRFGKTITISASGANAGYVAFHSTPIFASDCSTISEGDGYSLEFIYYQLHLNQELIYASQTGGAQSHIHAKDLNPILINFPEVDEQEAIARAINEIEHDIQALELNLNKIEHTKEAIIHKLLTGAIRLI